MAHTVKPTLSSATFIRRYKRFLADVELASGEMTIYVPNTGAMTNCGSAGDTVWFSTSSNPTRKYQHTWELTERNGHLICVNTARANQFAGEALRSNRVKGLTDYEVKPEVKYGDSRIDFLLTRDEQKCYVEVKSCTLLEDGQGYFPDTVTVRGQKHLKELTKIAQEGHRAVLLFCILHSGIDSVLAAHHIDPTYAVLLDNAKAQGVEVLTYKPDLRGMFEYDTSA
ncbi:DNA/RNA nuclease SfsA [Echinimonas agarilytica]|uniref:Sugar fermentation stimulation protein homolog n=1 Tax=Echinimonas agarilytica TaxID=1215918 RepID=A0AA41W5F3_9GAMM|nr:DNA/RNA nuclease SfsA [Echinimonas agarilytica]MCM2678763.1 DNA/RNA nuclease SfsA [Echinimonas agarilytica]